MACQSLELPIAGYPPVAACCAAGDACGLDASFLAEYGASFEVTCQARDQPGVIDASCPISVPIMAGSFQFTFPGCCRAETSTCGYMLDRAAGLIEIGLGCVAGEPFLDGEAALPCGG